MDKHLIAFGLIFLLLIAASLTFANVDQISPAVTQAKAENALGPTAAEAISQGLTWIGKILLGGLFAGVMLTVYTEGRKAYRTWTRSQQARRWQAGPNAQWQSQSPGMPRLKREDLILMALASGQKIPLGPTSRTAPGAKRAADTDESIELEF